MQWSLNQVRRVFYDPSNSRVLQELHLKATQITHLPLHGSKNITFFLMHRSHHLPGYQILYRIAGSFYPLWFSTPQRCSSHNALPLENYIEYIPVPCALRMPPGDHGLRSITRCTWHVTVRLLQWTTPASRTCVCLDKAYQPTLRLALEGWPVSMHSWAPSVCYCHAKLNACTLDPQARPETHQSCSLRKTFD